MNNFMINAGSYLISTIIGLYIIIVLLRFLLQLVKADFYNPLSQFIVKATSPVLIPMRRFIPGLFGLDIASLLLAYLLQCIENFLLFAMQGISLNPFLILWHSIGSLLSLLLYIYFFAIIVQIVISWISPGNYNPAIALIHRITEPVLQPARRLLPPFSGLDLSPILVFVVLNILIMFVPVIFG